MGFEGRSVACSGAATDPALIWLADQSQAPALAAYLNTNAKALFIDEAMAGDELRLKFNDPAFDNRTPDVIVQPIYGTIYTTSGKKVAEHGGFSFGNTNVGLIVSNPHLRGRVLKTPVATSQVAPTILRSLGLASAALDAVQKEETPALPGLGGLGAGTRNAEGLRQALPVGALHC